MTHDVDISIGQKIAFPALCVVCEKENPDSEVKLSFLDAKFSAGEAASTLLTGSTYHAENSPRTFRNIPACTKCAARLTYHHMRLKVVNYVAWSASVVLAIFLPVSILWKAVIFLAVFILPIGIAMAHPPAMDVSISKETATFQFTSEKFAAEFKMLNLR